RCRWHPDAMAAPPPVRAIAKDAAMIARLVPALAVCAALMLPHQAAAQDNWPQHPLKIEVISAAGGLTDIAARVVAKYLAPALGQPVVVENRPGAGGNLAAGAVAHADPDGT